MNTEELLAILRLQATKNVGDIIAKKLISVTGSASEIFKQKKTTLEKINGIGSYATQHLFDKKNKYLAEQELNYITKNNIEYACFLEESYPNFLKQCIDAPILFFKDGNINFNNRRIISIVGTRSISSYGRNVIKTLIADLKQYNPVIVSGFAYGCDIEAHKQALENNLQTIAVLAHGLEEIYPKVHKKYIHQVNKNGGFISEFWHDKKPLRENFLKRNRIVAGISQATIVIESAEKGGSLVTADIANSYSKEVFAVVGRTTDIYSKGCNNLIKKHKANILTDANDIIEQLNWDLEKATQSKKNIQTELFLNLSDVEQKVYDYLKENGRELLDTISLNCNIPVYELSSVLTTLELQGVIKRLPGKMYEL